MSNRRWTQTDAKVEIDTTEGQRWTGTDRDSEKVEKDVKYSVRDKQIVKERQAPGNEKRQAMAWGGAN